MAETGKEQAAESEGGGDSGKPGRSLSGRLKGVAASIKSRLPWTRPEKEVEVQEYHFETHGPLVEPGVPAHYEVLEDYWIEEGLSKAFIVNNPKTKQNEYLLFEPVLSRFDYELLERIYGDLRDLLILPDEEIHASPRQVLLEKVYTLLDEYGLSLEWDQLFRVQYYILRNFLGWSRIDALMKDDLIEDISCDGIEIPIFLYHRTYHNIRTNTLFDEESLNALAITLAQRSGKHISVSNPILDSTLPDGSRLQLTLGTEVTTRGTSFTIRKFRSEPFTPIELLDKNTFNVDELVYFWLAIENNKSLLFIGGTASGKTTSLNAVSHFIPPLAKVVSIEDTREITLYHENWIATVTRAGTTETSASAIDMFDLLKAAMRQRPEYIIVGEVRGVEAQTLFQAMNTGHTTFSTMHAGDIDAAIHRLENEPLNVPRNMIQALDVVSLQALIYRGTERVRRATEIVEIIGIDPRTDNIQVNNVFEYDPVTDVTTFTGRSKVYNEIMAVRGWDKEMLNAEIGKRREVLEAMHDQEIRDYISVSCIFQAYAISAEHVIEHIHDLHGLIE